MAHPTKFQWEWDPSAQQEVERNTYEYTTISCILIGYIFFLYGMV